LKRPTTTKVEQFAANEEKAKLQNIYVFGYPRYSPDSFHGGKVLCKKLPKRFRHTCAPFGNRSRVTVTQKKVQELVETLRAVTTECTRIFLVSTVWEECGNYMTKLCKLVEGSESKEGTRKKGIRLLKTRTIEATDDMLAHFLPLSNILSAMPYYAAFHVSLDHIDKCSCYPQDVDTPDAARQRHAETTEASGQRRYRDRTEVRFRHRDTLILFNLPDASARTEEAQMRDLVELSQGLPAHLSNAQLKWAPLLGSNVASLREIVNETTKNATASKHSELQERVMRYCLRKGD
jgi:hypothetical protein